MTLLLVFAIMGAYVAGWFTTALAITQVGLPSRGCVKGCTFRLPDYDPYRGTRKPPTGAHQAGCQKPHFELTDAATAAMYATAWPYVIFHGLLVVSERNAKHREDERIAKKRPIDTDALDAVLMDEHRTLPPGRNE